MTVPESSSLVLIDTSAWICHFDRKGYLDIKSQISTLLDENLAAITGSILIELIQGCRTLKEKTALNKCIKGIHQLQIIDDHWHKAADYAYSLRRKGVTASVVDALIATIAIEYQCKLLHKDSDYNLIAKHTPLKLYSPDS